MPNDIVQINSNEDIYYSILTIKTVNSGDANARSILPKIDIGTIDDKYANRFKNQMPPTGS